MIEIAFIVGIYILDLTLVVVGVGSYLLILLPLRYYVSGRSLPVVLAGAFLAGALLEQMHGLLPGTILFGLGLGVFGLTVIEKSVDWRQPLARAMGFLLVVAAILISRGLLSYLFFEGPPLPAVLPWLITVFLGFFFAWMQPGVMRAYNVRRKMF